MTHILGLPTWQEAREAAERLGHRMRWDNLRDCAVCVECGATIDRMPGGEIEGPATYYQCG